jgi:hypothetical protein
MAIEPKIPGVGAAGVAPDVTTISLSGPAYGMRLYGRKGGVVPCRISFFVEDRFVTLTGETGQDPAQPLTGHVLSFQTSKDLQAPAGSFTITLHNKPLTGPGVEGRYIADLLAPMDMVVIAFGRDDGDEEADAASAYRLAPNEVQAVMVGLVDKRPTEVEGLDGLGVSRQVIVTGFDLGKLLLNASLYYFKEAPQANLQAYTSAKFRILEDEIGKGVDKATFVAYLIEQYLYEMTSISYRRPAGEKARVYDLLGFVLGNMHVVNGAPAKFPLPRDFFVSEQNLHACISGIAEAPLGEFFVDTWPDDEDFVAAMVPDIGVRSAVGANGAIDGVKTWACLREPPFSRKDWSRLPLYFVDDRVVISSQLGGEPTIYNTFYCKAQAFSGWGDKANYTLSGVPIVNTDSIAKHGYRPMIASSNMIPGLSPDNANVTGGAPLKDVVEIQKHLTRLLYTYFAPAADFEAGSMSVQGHPFYRVGTRLMRTFLDRLDVDTGRAMTRCYYVEGVSHDWQAFGTCRTNLRLTRGLPADADRFPLGDGDKLDALASARTAYPFRKTP